jgi:hypothetical protein
MQSHQLWRPRPPWELWPCPRLDFPVPRVLHGNPAYFKFGYEVQYQTSWALVMLYFRHCYPPFAFGLISAVNAILAERSFTLELHFSALPLDA